MTKYIRIQNVPLPGGYVNDSTTDVSIGAHRLAIGKSSFQTTTRQSAQPRPPTVI